MSALEKNLTVLTEHIDDLAGKQESAAVHVLAAKRTVTEGIAGRMWLSHGPICASTNMAVATVDEARSAAMSTQYKSSTSLAEKLKWASINYNDTDWRNAGVISGCQV
jgi:hypothetical protein